MAEVAAAAPAPHTWSAGAGEEPPPGPSPESQETNDLGICGWARQKLLKISQGGRSVLGIKLKFFDRSERSNPNQRKVLRVQFGSGHPLDQSRHGI